MRSVELFAGGGGLALGTHLAGFSTEVVAEWNSWCCDTLRENRDTGYPLAHGMTVREGDVREVDWSGLQGRIDLVSGGPPCQPFSAGGQAKAHGDSRDMFPATAEVIRQIQPKAFIIENVRGLTRARFAPYFEYIQARLAYPNIRPRPDESWTDHYSRLTRRSRSVDEASHYNVTATLVNAADYGVPQQRWRVFLVGFRSDIDSLWAFPPATHSKELLRIEKQVTGRYWERHGVAPADRPESSVRRPIAEVPSGLKPWRTVRDAIGEMPPPTLDASERYLNHVLQPGARSYPGHTGSPIDEPAKALKAGVHGVPGGENMLRNPDGSIRYFTVREAARLQTFPDRYALHGPWSEAMRQLGNAVPALLAQAVASSVHEHLALNEVRSYLTHDSHLGAESAAPSNEVAA